MRQLAIPASPLPSESDDLTQARRDFDRWRRGRPRGERIPGALWKKAILLARSQGVSRVSQALRLDYYALQRRADLVPARTRAPEPSFVEIALPAAAGSTRCLIELADERGRPLRVELAGVSSRDLASFVRSIARSEA
jgi:hypothetical protein